jgi:type VI secretion system protein ImpA
LLIEKGEMRMASPEVLDFPRLVAPIPGSNPAGKDLRADYSPKAIYREIKGARDKAREAERYLLYKGGLDDHGHPVPPPDWRPVIQLAPPAIAEQSKDLELVALLTEALARKQGFAGLRDGFRLARELAEKFWDQLYPTPDEEGVRSRIAPLMRLNGEEGEGLLVAPIYQIPITAGGAAGSFSVTDYRLALELDGIADPDKRARRLEQPGALTVQTFDKSVAATSADAFRNLLEDIAQSWEEFQKLGQVLEQLCNSHTEGVSGGEPVVFSTSAIREALDACRETVQKIAGAQLGLLDQGGGAEEGTSSEEGGQAMAGGEGRGTGGAVGSREEAFRTLLRVAEFFKRTEPHSPVSYALEQAVRWGRMPLPQLLDELIPEDPVRQQLFKLIGIAPRPSEGTR